MPGDDPTQDSFPVACHAQLVYTPNGPGVDDPVGVTFTSQNNVAAQTFSLITTTTALAATSTPVTSKSPTPAVTTSTSPVTSTVQL
jgi:hypothetical protein